jgi:hypothetical protein
MFIKAKVPVLSILEGELHYLQAVISIPLAFHIWHHQKYLDKYDLRLLWQWVQRWLSSGF